MKYEGLGEETNMLRVLDLTQQEQWDTIVRSFNDYDVYWLSGYVKAFQIHGDGDPLLFYYNDGTTKGINVVMKRDISRDERLTGRIKEGLYFDFATPYGYGGWIIEGNESERLFNTYKSWVDAHGIISEFVRFHPLIKNHEFASSFYEIVQLGEVIHMDLKSEEDIWNNLISKNRNAIRKAIKNGIKIYNGRFPDIFDKFQKIYNDTMDKDNAEDYYYFDSVFYESILDDLPFNSQIFWAEKEGEIISASIVLETNGRMNYHLSGSNREFNSIAPTNLLLYKAALWGCANGYKSFYLGGGVGSEEDSLFKFKKSFYKGVLNHFYIGKKIYNHEKYDILVSCRDCIERPSFFPKYRA